MTVDFNRFTGRARKVVILARTEAQQLNHNYTGTEHILLALAIEMHGVAGAILRKQGLTAEIIRKEALALMTLSDSPGSLGQLPFTERTKKLLDLAQEEAGRLGHGYVGTEHLLLGLLAEGEGIGAVVLRSLGCSLDSLRGQVLETIGAAEAHPSCIL